MRHHLATRTRTATGGEGGNPGGDVATRGWSPPFSECHAIHRRSEEPMMDQPVRNTSAGAGWSKPCRTTPCSRLPPASAPPSLRLPGATHRGRSAPPAEIERRHAHLDEERHGWMRPVHRWALSSELKHERL